MREIKRAEKPDRMRDISSSYSPASLRMSGAAGRDIPEVLGSRIRSFDWMGCEFVFVTCSAIFQSGNCDAPAVTAVPHPPSLRHRNPTQTVTRRPNLESKTRSHFQPIPVTSGRRLRVIKRRRPGHNSKQASSGASREVRGQKNAIGIGQPHWSGSRRRSERLRRHR